MTSKTTAFFLTTTILFSMIQAPGKLDFEDNKPTSCSKHEEKQSPIFDSDTKLNLRSRNPNFKHLGLKRDLLQPKTKSWDDTKNFFNDQQKAQINDKKKAEMLLKDSQKIAIKISGNFDRELEQKPVAQNVGKEISQKKVGKKTFDPKLISESLRTNKRYV